LPALEAYSAGTLVLQAWIADLRGTILGRLGLGRLGLGRLGRIGFIISNITANPDRIGIVLTSTVALFGFGLETRCFFGIIGNKIYTRFTIYDFFCWWTNPGNDGRGGRRSLVFVVDFDCHGGSRRLVNVHRGVVVVFVFVDIISNITTNPDGIGIVLAWTIALFALTRKTGYFVGIIRNEFSTRITNHNLTYWRTSVILRLARLGV